MTDTHTSLSLEDVDFLQERLRRAEAVLEALSWLPRGARDRPITGPTGQAVAELSALAVDGLRELRERLEDCETAPAQGVAA